MLCMHAFSGEIAASLVQCQAHAAAAASNAQTVEQCWFSYSRNLATMEVSQSHYSDHYSDHCIPCTPTSGFELRFTIGSQHPLTLGGPDQNTSRIQHPLTLGGPDQNTSRIQHKKCFDGSFMIDDLLSRPRRRCRSLTAGSLTVWHAAFCYYLLFLRCDAAANV